MLEFLNFRIKSLVIVVLLCLIETYSAKAQQVICTFDQPPTAPLYNCGSTVIANININQLSSQYNMIELYYPLQFDLFRLNNLNVSNESVYAVNGSLI